MGAALVSPNGAVPGSVKTAWRTRRKDTGLDGKTVQPTSFRHTIARWMRSHSVSPWEVAAFLGHRMRDIQSRRFTLPLTRFIWRRAARLWKSWYAPFTGHR